MNKILENKYKGPLIIIAIMVVGFLLVTPAIAQYLKKIKKEVKKDWTCVCRYEIVKAGEAEKRVQWRGLFNIERSTAEEICGEWKRKNLEEERQDKCDCEIVGK